MTVLAAACGTVLNGKKRMMTATILMTPVVEIRKKTNSTSH